MERDTEQKFVLSTHKWRHTIIDPRQSVFIHQGYITTPHGAKALRKLLCAETFNALAEIGFYDPAKNHLILNDPALTCRVRVIAPYHKSTPRKAELTIKLYRGERADNQRVLLPLDISQATHLLNAGYADRHTSFFRHYGEYGHQMIDGKNQPIRWKVDVFRPPLKGLVLAKAERSTGRISTIEVFEGAAKSVTHNRNYTGYMLGQFKTLYDLRQADTKQENLHAPLPFVA